MNSSVSHLRMNGVLLALLVTVIVWNFAAAELRASKFRQLQVRLVGPLPVGSSKPWRFDAVELQGSVEGPIEWPDNGIVRFTLLATEASESPRYIVKLSALRWHGGARLQTGDTVHLQGRRMCPLMPEVERHLVRRGALCYLLGQTVQRTALGTQSPSSALRLAASIQDRVGESDSLAVLLAVTLGSRNLLGPLMLALFQATGTSHLLVISGFHVGLLYGVVFFSVRTLWVRSPTLVCLFPAALPAAWLSLLAAGGYTYLSGGALPAMRALVILAIFAFGVLLGKTTSSGRNLLIALLGVQLIWPMSIFEAGCQLTFSALFGLWAVSPLLTTDSNRGFWTGDRPTLFARAADALRRTVIASTGAWLGTTPVALWWFGTIVPLAPLFNLLVLIPFCAVYVAGGAIGVLLYSAFGWDWWVRLTVDTGRYLLDVLWQVREFAESLGLGMREVDEKLRVHSTIGCGVVSLLLLALPRTFCRPGGGDEWEKEDRAEAIVGTRAVHAEHA
ncbi:MAG: ComEC/Rec2 family competence protein [Bdellovibrionales bacterium]|nr:ComEC/Rec2 family competence protein [Bdellovibrionales bacterium]